MIPGIVAGQRTPAQIIQNLFAAGQQGFWLPFTDFASLSQDSAGTLPYTALEQPVGRVLDRSGQGNHASQATSTARGVVSARVNLLQKSDQIGDGSYWYKVNGLSVTLGAAQGIGGSYSMSRIIKTAGTPNQRAQQVFPTAPNTLHTIKLVIQKDSVHGGRLVIYNAGVSVAVAGANIAWAGGEPVFGSLTGWVSSPVATAIGDGNFLVTATFNPGVYTACALLIYIDNTTGATLLVGDAEIKLASQTALPYQRVNTPTDYDSVGFPKYLRLDGVDDFYTCGGGGSSTGFYYSDVITNKKPPGVNIVLFSDLVGNSGYEIALNTTNGLISLKVGNGSIMGTLNADVPLTLGVAAHVACSYDGTNATITINGVAKTATLSPAAAGLSTITLYYGGASTNYFNGQVTEPIYRAGPPPSAYERGVIRAYQMQKAGLL